MRLKLQKGFTLVELLIVIALIAILSVAVLATINPIEQTNKARDAQYKNDAAEVLNALERYYAANNNYPWGDPSEIGETAISSLTDTFGVVTGIGASGGEEGYGVLVDTSELKTSFAAKAPFKSTADPIDMMYVYNNGSDSNFVCFVPKAKANRSLYGSLRCLDVASGTMGEPGDGSCEAIVNTSASWTVSTGGSYSSSTMARFLCVPETAIVPNVTPVAGVGGT